MHWLLTAHVRHYRRQYRGSGHLWQGRFHAFPIQEDGHLLTVLRYVERNPVRAQLVSRAEDWPWSSLRGWLGPPTRPWLHAGPVPRPADWCAWVNTPLAQEELQQLRSGVRRGTPFGTPAWTSATAAELGLEGSLRPPGRPRQSGAAADRSPPAPRLFA